MARGGSFAALTRRGQRMAGSQSKLSTRAGDVAGAALVTQGACFDIGCPGAGGARVLRINALVRQEVGVPPARTDSKFSEAGHRTPWKNFSREEGGHRTPWRNFSREEGGHRTPFALCGTPKSGTPNPLRRLSAPRRGYTEPLSRSAARQKGYAEPLSATVSATKGVHGTPFALRGT